MREASDILDHFVDNGQQRLSDGQAERFRGLEVDHELGFGGL
jgi:hypothetical protein